MKQSDARVMFPQHKLVFANGVVTIYDLRDTKKENVVATVSLLAMAPGAHAFLQMAPGKPPARFAVVKSYTTEAKLLKAVEVDNRANGKSSRVSLKNREAITAKVNDGDFDTCLKILSQHFHGSIDELLMKYVTTQAEKAFGYRLEKLGKKIADGFGWNRAIQQMHGREEKPVGKTIAQIAAEAPEIKTGKEPVVAQDVKTPRAPKAKLVKLPAHVETLKDVTDANKKVRAPKNDPAKWSVSDEKIYEGIVQGLQHLTLRLSDINAARLAGISIAAFDKKLKVKK